MQGVPGQPELPGRIEQEGFRQGLLDSKALSSLILKPGEREREQQQQMLHGEKVPEALIPLKLQAEKGPLLSHFSREVLLMVYF